LPSADTETDFRVTMHELCVGFEEARLALEKSKTGSVDHATQARQGVMEA
jgi:hypothetical protein